MGVDMPQKVRATLPVALESVGATPVVAPAGVACAAIE
jgi:hypothetical protein